MEKSSGLSNLPSFEDRLPDLVLVIQNSARKLETVTPPGSYLPTWEDLYQSVHSMKGVVGILKAPEPLRLFILNFHEAIAAATVGQKVVRDTAATAKCLAEIANHLNQKISALDVKFLDKKVREIESLYVDDLPHEKRTESIPGDLYYVSEIVSKRVREMLHFGWSHCIVEDEILLEHIPFWRAQLQESLVLPDGNMGLLINFLPFISSEGSRTLKVWAWVAAPTDSRAALKQKVKDEMPKVKITSLKLVGE